MGTAAGSANRCADGQKDSGKPDADTHPCVEVRGGLRDGSPQSLWQQARPLRTPALRQFGSGGRNTPIPAGGIKEHTRSEPQPSSAAVSAVAQWGRDHPHTASVLTEQIKIETDIATNHSKPVIARLSACDNALFLRKVAENRRPCQWAYCAHLNIISINKRSSL